MYCLANTCYVCFETTNKLLSNINNPLSINKDIIHIIGYLPFDLTWLKTKRIILICEACCLRLRESYQFMKMCRKNSAILKSNMDLLNSTPMSDTDNQAELTVMLDLNVEQMHINEIKYEIQLEDEEIYTNEYETVIEETEDIFVNLEDSFVKEENIWKREEENGRNEYSIDNNSTEITDKESDLEMSVNSNAHITYTDCVGTGFTCKPVARESAVKKDCFPRATQKRDNEEGMRNSFSRIIVNGVGKKFEKRTCCIYCKELVLKLPRHLLRNHKDEKDVREMCCLPARDSRRLFILARMRKEGNFYYNQERLESQQGNLIVKRRSNAAQDGYKYRPCPYCLGYYKYRFLYLHLKRCQATNRQLSNIENS